MLNYQLHLQEALLVLDGNFIHINGVWAWLLFKDSGLEKAKQSKGLNLHSGVGCLPLWHVCITLVNLQWG